MLDDFIRQKEMMFVKGKDMPDFWGGVDSHGDHSYELFFTAGKAEGPSHGQLATYNSFLESVDEVCGEIHTRVKALLLSAGPEVWQRYKNSPLGLLFVSVFPEHSEDDIELTCEISRKGFLFRKRKSMVARIRDNTVVSVNLL